MVDLNLNHQVQGFMVLKYNALLLRSVMSEYEVILTMHIKIIEEILFMYETHPLTEVASRGKFV